MKKMKCALTAFFAVLMAVALVFSAQSVFALDENTDNRRGEESVYGDIPSEWASEEEYPFVLFKSGEAVFAAGTWFEALSKANLEYLNEDDDEIVMLMRSDASEGAADYNNWAYVRGKLTIDLGGNTLTVEKNLFKPNDKSDYSTNIIIKNGDILLEKSSKLVYYASSATAENGVEGSDFNITFMDTDIGFAEGATTKELVSTMTMKENLPVIANLSFIRCNIDLKTNAPDGSVTFLNLSTDADNHSANVVIDGGSISLKNGSYVLAKLKKSDKAPDTLTFTNEQSGEYTNLILPIGELLPESARAVNGGELVFAKSHTDGDNQVYALFTAREISLRFKPKSSITLGSELIFNVYIPISDELEGFSLDGKSYEKGDSMSDYVVTADGVDYYCISLPLPAAEAARGITFNVTLKVGEKYSSGSWTFSVTKYAEKVISASKSEVEIKLVKDVLAYVKSAYAYFESEDAESVSASIDEILGGYSGSYGISSRDPKSYDNLKAATLSFDARPSFKLYVAKSFEAKDYRFYSNGSEITDITVGEDAGGVYVALNLFAYQMCADVIYTVSGESGAYSINNYYSYISKKEFKDEKKDALLDLVRRFYNYSQSSADYYISHYAKDLSAYPVDIGEYKVAYPEGASANLIEKAEKIASAIEVKLGREISVISDKEASASDKLIIVGQSNLIGSDTMLKLSKHDSADAFIMDFTKKYAVICGKTESSTLRAGEYFIESYIDTLGAGESKIDLSLGRTQIKTYMNVGGVDIVVETVSSVFDVKPGVNTDGLYPSRVNTAHYPSIIELNYNGESNGKLIAIFCLSDTPTVAGDPDTNGCVMESADGGLTWKMIARPEEAFDTSIVGISMAHLYELPVAVGDMPAGTLLYSGNSVDYDVKSHIAIWRSFDCGYTWEEYVIIDEAGGTREGIWEPYVWYEESDGYLYCFYSDDSDPAHDQKLVYKRTLDGVNWSEAEEVCAFKNEKDRPGMFIMTKMGNGEYFMVYEYYVGGKGRVYYKTTTDVSEWSADSVGTLLTDENGYTVKGAPFCIWTPYGGENGMLLVTGKEDVDGGQRHLVFVSFDYGKTWTTMENPLPYDISIAVRGTNRIGHSPSFIVSADPSVIYYVNTTVIAETGYQRIEFAKMKIYSNENVSIS